MLKTIVDGENCYAVHRPDGMLTYVRDFTAMSLTADGRSERQTPPIQRTLEENRLKARAFHEKSPMESVLALKGKFEGKHLAVIGAGASALDYTAELRARDDIVTLGINDANKTTPWDIHFAVDRIHDRHNRITKKTLLVTCPSACHRLLYRKWAGIYMFRVWFDDDPFWQENKFPLLYMKSATSTAALAFAWYLGFKVIHLYGHDFVFEQRQEDTDFAVECRDGVFRMTNRQYVYQAELVEACCTVLRDAGVNIIYHSNGIL